MVEFGNGVVRVSECTQEEFDECVANLREKDREEYYFGDRVDRLEDYERCFAIRVRGELVGFCGIGVPTDSSAMCDERFLCYFSTNAVDRNRVAFVRHSRDVMKYIASQAPAHVRFFVSMPMESYTGSIIWHERVLGMSRVENVDALGCRFVVFGIDRDGMFGHGGGK